MFLKFRLNVFSFCYIVCVRVCLSERVCVCMCVCFYFEGGGGGLLWGIYVDFITCNDLCPKGLRAEKA